MPAFAAGGSPAAQAAGRPAAAPAAMPNIPIRQPTKMIENRGPSAQTANPSTVRKGDDKVGRNDPCPCGSGKKYKKCHGAAA
jgi:preprotein translocase subunit SecA